MPIYEYRCAACGHYMDALQKMSDAPLRKCPECGKKVERVLFAPPIHFKGSGYYSTDYGKGGKRATKEKADGGDSTTSDSSSAKKGDSAAASTSTAT